MYNLLEVLLFFFFVMLLIDSYFFNKYYILSILAGILGTPKCISGDRE